MPHFPAPYQFAVGDFLCAALYDSIGVYDRPEFFSNAPPRELAAAFARRGETADEIPTPYCALLVRTSSHTVLIDTGMGQSPADPAQGQLLRSLACAGTTPDMIDTVLLTHGHLDHIGGTLDANGGPAFPNARYVMFRQEWDFWDQEQPNLSALDINAPRWVAVAHRQLRPLRDRVNLPDADTEICPGVSALFAGGHTPGHMVVRLDSRGATLLYVSDLVLHPLALEHPKWHTKYELDLCASQAAKRRFLALAAVETMLVHAMHFPFPGLGRVAPVDDHWSWQPLISTG